MNDMKKEIARMIRTTTYPLYIDSSLLESNTNKMAVDLVVEYLKNKGWAAESGEHCGLSFVSQLQSDLFHKELLMAQKSAEPYLKELEQENIDNIKKQAEKKKDKNNKSV